VAHEIRFEDVEFEYREGLPVVRDFNVTVAGGSVVALVGRSGAGKTTVTDLVARFHDPTQGRIFLNGVDIRDLRGFDTKLLLELRTRLDALEIPQPPFTKAVGHTASAHALGTSQHRGTGRIHRVDKVRQAAAPSISWHPK